jgi:sulfide:quinone oxidoreductase
VQVASATHEALFSLCTRRVGITVIGAGFGALSSVLEIRRRDAKVEITLIAPRAELHYLPGIIWIPSGLRTREQLIVPLANFFQAHAGDDT